MPSFETKRIAAHTPADMFDLVADVEQYPQFLPLCTGLSVRGRSNDAQGREVLIANMSVGYKAIRERFISRVTLDREHLKILVEYVDGPFSHLENVWTFKPAGDDGQSTEIGFQIDYEFRRKTLGMLMGAMFDRAFRHFAEAFETRADVIYGAGKPAPAASLS